MLARSGKKKPHSSTSVPSTHLPIHMCTPSTHCHIIWRGKAHRDKATLEPLHVVMFDCSGRQKSLVFPIFHGRERTGRSKKLCNPLWFFSP